MSIWNQILEDAVRDKLGTNYSIPTSNTGNVPHDEDDYDRMTRRHKQSGGRGRGNTPQNSKPQDSKPQVSAPSNWDKTKAHFGRNKGKYGIAAGAAGIAGAGYGLYRYLKNRKKKINENTNFLVSSFMTQLFETDEFDYDKMVKRHKVATGKLSNWDKTKAHFGRNKGKYAGAAGLAGAGYGLYKYLKRRKQEQD